MNTKVLILFIFAISLANLSVAQRPPSHEFLADEGTMYDLYWDCDYAQENDDYSHVSEKQCDDYWNHFGPVIIGDNTTLEELEFENYNQPTHLLIEDLY